MENRQSQHREPPVVLLLLWVLLWLVMWFGAITGPVFVVLGVLSFFLDLSDVIDIGGKPVQTTGQKLTFLTVAALTALVGNGFLWLRRRGYLKFGPEAE